MSTNIYIPIPLFDSLENLKQNNFTLQSSIEDANYDFKQAKEYLSCYNGSEATFNSYRREIARLLHWSWFVAKKSIKDLRRADFEAFVKFCQNPFKEWIGLKQVSRFIDKGGIRQPNPEWRPFMANVSKRAHDDGIIPDIENYRLSQSGLQAIFSVISSFYNYLLQESYTEVNPAALVRQKSQYIRKQQGLRVIRRLSELQWSYVIETTELLAFEKILPSMRELY